MTLKPGTHLGPYEILSAIGAGGMGEVYKGRDTRLDRIVALKVLSAHLADRPDVRERIEREAKSIANLKHPHICVIHDIGEQNGTQYLVMEYLEGETMAHRLVKGPLPLDQVLQFAIEIADALDKAHRKGVTHRDLKPGNIMLTKDGTKLLDFGLAKLRQEAAPANVPFSQLPTAKSALTEHGTILGTLQYMASEQVEGKTDDIDARTDIFSFGAVVYEMVTGRKAFEGSTSASVMSKILQVDPPPMSSLQPVTPPALDRVVKRCLAKEQEGRWQSAADLEAELQWIKEGGSQIASAPEAKPAAKNWKRRLAFNVAGLLAWAVTALVIWWNFRAPAPQPVTRLALTLPAGQRLAALDQPAIAISPDGKNIVYVAVPFESAQCKQGGTQQLFLRPLDGLETKSIAGTEGAVAPFFSPDSEWIGFFAGGKLKKVSANGGAAVTLASAPQPGGASWSSQGILAWQGSTAALGLQQVSQEGGTPQALTRLAKRDFYHRWPDFLPGGKVVLFAGSSTTVTWNSAQIAVQPVGTSERRNLAQGSQPRYASTGHLLYAQGGTLMAAPFDERRLALTGAAVPAIEGVMQSMFSGAAQYSLSSTGTLAYLAGGLAGSQSRMVWVSRSGQEQPLPAALHNYFYPRVSSDGRRVAVAIADQDTQVWIYDSFRDTLTRLTFEGNDNNTPAWSPDGRRIAFRSNRAGGGQGIFSQAADGSGGAERLTTSDYLYSAASFSPDGQLLAFMETRPETGRDIWVLRLADRKAQPFLRTPYEETAPKFSPDGRWLAYSSDESGRREIYVQPYPGPGGKWQISTDGGQEPVWNPRGGELFYRSGSKIMAVDVSSSAGVSAGPKEQPGMPNVTYIRKAGGPINALQ